MFLKRKGSVYCKVYRVVGFCRVYCCVYFKNPASLRLMVTLPIRVNWMSGIARIMLVYQLILKADKLLCIYSFDDKCTELEM